MFDLPLRFYEKCKSEGIYVALQSASKFTRRRVGFKKWQQRLVAKYKYMQFRRVWGSSLADPYKTITVNPRNIAYLRVPHFYLSYSRYGTHILDGEWDQEYSEDSVGYFRLEEDPKIAQLKNYLFYQSVENWINENRDWTKTRCYQVLAHRKGVSAAEKKGEKLRQIRDSIESKGYLTQQEIENDCDSLSHRIWSVPPEHNEIVVNIGRNGELIFDDGKHRFCIAKTIGINQIPVRVLMRHREWQKIREEINSADDLESLSNRAKKHLSHPDLEDIVPDSWL